MYSTPRSRWSALILFVLCATGGPAGCVGELTGPPGDEAGGAAFAAPTDDRRPLARGVEVERVTANQSVEVVLVDAGQRVAPASRGAQLVAGRETTLRATVLRTGAAPAQLVARLELRRDGQAAITHDEQPVRFAGDSTRTVVDFRPIPAGRIDAGVAYAIAVLDVSPQPQPGTDSARWPHGALDSATHDALEARRTRGLRVVVVPLAVGGRAAPPVDLGAFRSLVEAMYPVAEGGVSLELHATVAVTIPGSVEQHPRFWMTPVLDRLHALRSAEGSGAYYYGVVQHDELFGVADGIPSAVSFGTTNDGIVTFAHELGHNLGLRHAPCGGAAGADASYPYASAIIGVEGYDPRSDRFLDREAHFDLMSYCLPAWLSDYHYDKLRRALASSAAAGSELAGLVREPVACDFRYP